MVDKIEQYGDVLKVILKPTRKYPWGRFFYCDSEDIDLVNNRTWLIDNDYVVTTERYYNSLLKFYFHKDIANKYLNLKPEVISHINLVRYDNVDSNLDILKPNQVDYNRPVRGYMIDKWGRFQACIIIDNKKLQPYSVAENELEVCVQQYLVETNFLRLQLKDEYYMFNFLEYRAGSEDILDLERTKKISPEEGTYQHVMRYADNAWYYYRFGLQEYFKDNRIAVPKFDLDENGFMVDKITRKRLCPF